MDAHSRVWYLLHKCNRARREHVASNMLFQVSTLTYERKMYEKEQKDQEIYSTCIDACNYSRNVFFIRLW